MAACFLEIPAKAGIPFTIESANGWIPAFAGISKMEQI
jgi:hypothetical protein